MTLLVVVAVGLLVGGLIQATAFPTLAAAMHDGYLHVSTEGGLAVAQDALGKGRGVAELLVKVIVVATGFVAIVDL